MKLLFKYLVMVVFIISCTNNNSNDMEVEKSNDAFFTIPIVKKNFYSRNTIYYYQSKVKRPYWECYCNFIYTNDPSDMQFKYADLEIEFHRYNEYHEVEFYRPSFHRIALKKINNRYKALVITWVNKALNIEEAKKISPICLNMTNSIDETTDTLYSTLSEAIIRKSYPKFNGIYRQIELDSISLDYRYRTDSYEFYNNIHLYNFEWGIGVWITKY